jgi:hypothetical protein
MPEVQYGQGLDQEIINRFITDNRVSCLAKVADDCYREHQGLGSKRYYFFKFPPAHHDYVDSKTG